MKSKALAAILALLIVTAPALAAPDRADLEKKLFEAYWLENGKRDLDAARDVYTEVSKSAAEWPDLRIRATFGMARIAARSGLDIGARLVDMAETLITKFPEKYDEQVLAMLTRELEDTKKVVEKYATADEVDAQIARFVEILAQGPDSRNGKAAVADLLLFGDLAVPRVAEGLHAKHPRAVAGAARVLVRLDTDLAAKALGAALSDPKLLYRAQAVRELGSGTGRHRRLFEQALADPKREVRFAAAIALGLAVAKHQTLASEVVKALGRDDADLRIRLLSVKMVWNTAEILRTADRLADDPDPGVRYRIARLISFLDTAEEVTYENLARIPGLFRIRDVGARKNLLSYAVRKGGDVAKQAVLRALVDDDKDLRRYAVSYIRGRSVAWTEEYVPALLASAEKIVLSEHVGTWSHSAQQTFLLLDRGKKNEENGMRFVALLGRLAKNALEDRRALAMGYLYGQLGKYPASVRLAAWDVLTRDGDRAYWLATLAGGLEDGVEERARAALDSQDPRLRVAALKALGRFQSDKTVLPLLVALTRDPNVKVRGRALEAALPLMPPEERQKAIVRALGDEDRSVRLTAVQGLRYLAGEDWHVALIDAVRKDPAHLSYPAMKAVVEMGNADATRRIFAGILEVMEGQSGYTLAAVWEVAGDVLTDRTVLEGLRHPEDPVRHWAADIASKRHLLDAWPILLSLQNTDHYRKNLEQIRSYHLGMKEYLDFRDSGGEDLYAKAEALSMSDRVEHRIAACHAYAVLSGSRALARLLDLVRDEDQFVRAAALEALKKLGAAPAGK